MPLSVGDKLGPYEILAPIGKGGMGEVYRAHDTRLGRDVAIKTSAQQFSDRFEREARAIAALNHPNICTLYDVSTNEAPNYLVMELIEGPTLAERIKDGAIPLDEALAIARKIADALEAAHEKGITHRDLKPANIKITHEGVVKVLDFGLAKATAPVAAGTTDPEASPTISMAATQAGVILGTAAYMSPEQARGKPVDKRADIWAFGVVLYEMLTGKRPFQGEDLTEVLASVVKEKPDLSGVPANVRRLLERCLEKDPKNRLRDIGDWELLLEVGHEVGQVPDLPPPAMAVRRAKLGWIAAAVLAAVLVAIAGISLWGWLDPTPPEPRNVVRLTTAIPVASVAGAIALSRDGSRLAYISGPQRQIYVRMMDQIEARLIPGSDGASFLCFSPDGQWISFVGLSPDFKLKKVAVAGGPTQVLADVTGSPGPPTQEWGLDDKILFATNGALMRIPAAGGKPETVATPDPNKGEAFYFGAQLLPGGNQVLTGVAVSTAAGSGGEMAAFNLQTREKKILVEGSSFGRYLPTGPGPSAGYLVYYVDSTGSLMAVPFDASHAEVKGPPVPVVDGVQGYGASPLAFFGISDSGTLAYVAGNPGLGSANTLVWVDRKGVEQPLSAPPRNYRSVRLSPDGQRIALGITGERSDVWVYDLGRGTLYKIATEQNGTNAIWTPDGKRLIYTQNPSALAWAPADNSAPASILASGEKAVIRPTSVSSDGTVVIGDNAVAELWVLRLPNGSSGEAKPLPFAQPFLESRSRNRYPAFSPDGGWVAYSSDETGSYEIYVAPYPGPGPKILISTEGGVAPHWSHDGRELFYRRPGGSQAMMVVDVQISPTFRAATPKVLFEDRGYAVAYDVSPDGKRLLMIKRPGPAQGFNNQVTIVLNWVDELRRRVPLPGK